MTDGVVTPDPIQVELDYYKERNAVIHTRNELLEKENRDAHNQIRDLKIQISRMEHPAGKAIDKHQPVDDEAFRQLTEGLTAEQKQTFKKFMEDDDDGVH